MSHELEGKDTRMTALINVTVNNGRRGPRVRRGSLIDESQTDRLTTNRTLLLKNVSATSQLLAKCEEKGVITRSQREVIEAERDEGDKRMQLLLKSMHLQETTVFKRFCEVLTMSGHPLISDYLRDSGLASRTYSYEDLWEQHPSLLKTLHKWEKEKLEAYITSKIKEEVVRFNMGEIQEDREKEVDMRLKQVQQSWKYQKEIKEKDHVVIGLQKRVTELEKLLSEKEKNASMTRMNLQRDIEKLSSNVQVAAKFNLANDNALRRLQETVDLYTVFGRKLETQLSEFDTAAATRRKKEPLIREETSLEGLQQKFDVERRNQHMLQTVTAVLSELRHLREIKQQHETLLESVNFLLTQLRTSVTSETDGMEQGMALRRAFASLVLRYESQIEGHTAEIDLLRRFIKGLLKPDEVPDEFKDLPLPSAERETLKSRISELEQEIEKLKTLKPKVIVRASPSPKSVSSEAFQPATYKHARPIVPLIKEPEKKETKNSPSVPNIPFSYHSRRAHREAKPKPERKPPNSKLVSTQVVNFL